MTEIGKIEPAGTLVKVNAVPLEVTTDTVPPPPQYRASVLVVSSAALAVIANPSLAVFCENAMLNSYSNLYAD
jgi:hypothetical protein